MGVSGPSLLVESTDSMMHYRGLPVLMIICLPIINHVYINFSNPCSLSAREFIANILVQSASNYQFMSQSVVYQRRQGIS